MNKGKSDMSMVDEFKEKYLQKDKTELYVPYNKHILYNIKTWISKAEQRTIRKARLEGEISCMENLKPPTFDGVITRAEFEAEIKTSKAEK